MTQAVSSCGGGSGRHAGRRSCGGRLSRQDPTMYRIIAVGRIVLYPEPTGIRLGMCGQGAMTSWCTIQCHQVVLVVELVEATVVLFLHCLPER